MNVILLYVGFWLAGRKKLWRIFGFYRVPEEISYEKAEIMVNEGIAQYENVDKYLEPLELELSEVES